MIATSPALASPRAEGDAAPLSSHRFWFAAIIVAGAFYLFEHNFDTSEMESYAPHIEEMTAMAGSDPARMLQVAIAFLAVGGLGFQLLLTARHPSWQPISWLSLLMLAVLSWCLASWLWSVAPSLTAQRLVVLLCCYVGAVGIGSALSPRELAGVAVAGSLAFLITGLVAELLLGNFLPWWSEYRFAGTLHPNAQGVNLGVLCCGAFCLARRDMQRAWLFWLLVAVGLGFTVLTKSRTSLAATLLALGAIWLLQASWRVRIAAFAGGVILAALAFLALVASGLDLEEEAQQAVLLGRQEQTESLTGRLPVWIELVDHIGKRPWLGHGYQGFWNPDNIETVSERAEWPVREAHNGYLDLSLSIGFIGCSLAIVTVLAGIWSGIQAYDASGDAAYGFGVGMLLFTLVTCCLESMMKPEFATFVTACAVAHLAHVRPSRVTA